MRPLEGGGVVLQQYLSHISQVSTVNFSLFDMDKMEVCVGRFKSTATH